MKRMALAVTLLSAFTGTTHLAWAGDKPLPQRVEVAFVLDTTGSMGDLIDGAKRKIWSIANTIVDANPDADIAMALVAYRDRGDDYVVKVEPLSEDIQDLYGKLTRLEALGGGDDPESVNEALAKAVNGLQWSSSDKVKRIVFLVGDAPPHMDYPQEKQYPDIVEDAVDRGIIVNTVQAGAMPETTGIWKEIAQYGHGRYMAIPQDGGEIVVTITPYDDDILHLQRELDGSIIFYGDRVQQDSIKRKLSEKAAAPTSAQLDNSEYYAKRAKKEVVTGGGDLLGDVRNGRVKLKKLKKSALPKELAEVPEEERQRWVDERLERRKDLEKKISDLVTKRDAFVAKERAKVASGKPADSFDEAVKETLRVQLN
jgi:hypothetical protein